MILSPVDILVISCTCGFPSYCCICIMCARMKRLVLSMNLGISCFGRMHEWRGQADGGCSLQLYTAHRMGLGEGREGREGRETYRKNASSRDYESAGFQDVTFFSTNFPNCSIPHGTCQVQVLCGSIHIRFISVPVKDTRFSCPRSANLLNIYLSRIQIKIPTNLQNPVRGTRLEDVELKGDPAADLECIIYSSVFSQCSRGDCSVIQN
jgi:hypothetical protein